MILPPSRNILTQIKTKIKRIHESGKLELFDSSFPRANRGSGGLLLSILYSNLKYDQEEGGALPSCPS